MLRVLALIALGALSAGCSSNFDSFSGAPRGVSGGSPGGPSVISGSGGGSIRTAVAGPPGCAGPISEYERVIDSDVETGHLNPGVFNRISSDLERVRASCTAGREAEARNQLAEVKRRYGYR